MCPLPPGGLPCSRCSDNKDTLLKQQRQSVCMPTQHNREKHCTLSFYKTMFLAPSRALWGDPQLHLLPDTDQYQ